MGALFQVCYFLVLAGSGLGARTKNKMYIYLKTSNYCIRTLNATHQAGCTSQRRGNVGIVHYVGSRSDFDWVLEDGPNPPYVVVINSVDLNATSIGRILYSKRVNGIMVISQNLSRPSSYPVFGFSSVDVCSNDKAGIYHNTSYKDCQKVKWNPTGTSLRFHDFGIPMFELTDPKDIDAVLNKCFYLFNSKKQPHPVCAAEMKSRMNAVIDSVTCIRRSNRVRYSFFGQAFCDPLGDKNVVTTMKTLSENISRQNKSVILIGAKLDATSLFMDTYNAADTAVAGIVTLLATAEAIWRVQEQINGDNNAKDILMIFFQGETFDYIGSSRVVYDMKLGTFPTEVPKSNKHTKTPVNLLAIRLEHLDMILELNQVGRRDDGGYLWAHNDPLNVNTTWETITGMIKDLGQIGKENNVSIHLADKETPLPPSFAQRFLKGKRDIPVLVIADHYRAYTNKFYNSRFDSAYLIDAANYPPGMNESEKYKFVTYQAELITNLSTTLAIYLFKASTGRLPPKLIKRKLQANPKTVTHLLYCFTVKPNCELFIESMMEDDHLILETSKGPFSYYVGTNREVSDITFIVRNLMARFTGVLEKLSREACLRKASQFFRYVWLQGKMSRQKVREGWCLRTQVLYTDAVSPAFVREDYDMLSGEYSTWTESRWTFDAIRVRLFLLPSREFQLLNLSVGITMLIISVMGIYYIAGQVEILFKPAPTASLIEEPIDNPVSNSTPISEEQRQNQEVESASLNRERTTKLEEIDEVC